MRGCGYFAPVGFDFVYVNEDFCHKKVRRLTDFFALSRAFFNYIFTPFLEHARNARYAMHSRSTATAPVCEPVASDAAPMTSGKIPPPAIPMTISPEISFFLSGRICSARENIIENTVLALPTPTSAMHGKNRGFVVGKKQSGTCGNHQRDACHEEFLRRHFRQNHRSRERRHGLAEKVQACCVARLRKLKPRLFHEDFRRP